MWLTDWVEPRTGVRVIFCPEVVMQLSRVAKAALTQRESGGILLGLRRNENIEVIALTLPQIRDRRYRFHFTRHPEGHRELAEHYWRAANGFVDYVGEWHSHPEFTPHPSYLDKRSWIRLARKSAPSFMLGLIVGKTALWLGLANKTSVAEMVPAPEGNPKKPYVAKVSD